MNRYNPDRKFDMIKKLLTTYDDIYLAKAFQTATKVKSGEFPSKIVWSTEIVAKALPESAT
ncbi:hypothetical protein L915_02666 [Phytophthora nicotianae]|uniref:Uncharacterized protein n=1 Tax=Phytophthora nicotianae TaxID=4792 RepID=W2HG34_PHYNI|nr:hypothetical protein L915_02666 [Phytophthora nicotianae]